MIMQRHYDFDTLVNELSEAIEPVLNKHKIPSIDHPLAVCALLEVQSSPLKQQKLSNGLLQRAGMLGVEAYLASFLGRMVELLKSPHSQTVNPVMESIVLALVRAKEPVPDFYLLRNTLRELLNQPSLDARGMSDALKDNSSLEPAFGSAKEYLLAGGIVANEVVESEGTYWRLAAAA